MADCDGDPRYGISYFEDLAWGEYAVGHEARPEALSQEEKA